MTSELQSRLEGDHAGTAIAPQTHAEQSCRRRCCIGQSSKSCLSRGLAGYTGQYHAGNSKVRMIENIEELALEAQFDALGQGEPFGEIKIAPGKIRPAQSIAAEIAELTILRVVAAIALSRAWIHGGDKGIRIQPLHRTGLGHAGDWRMFIERHTWNYARELWPAALNDSVSAG